jgi:hypothetical protein
VDGSCDGAGPCGETCTPSSNDKNKEALGRLMRMSFKQDNLSSRSK